MRGQHDGASKRTSLLLAMVIGLIMFAGAQAITEALLSREPSTAALVRLPAGAQPDELRAAIARSTPEADLVVVLVPVVADPAPTAPSAPLTTSAPSSSAPPPEPSPSSTVRDINQLPRLAIGARRVDVVELKALLRQAGHDPASEGDAFDEPTKTAVQKFQQARGVEGDGIVGPTTWRLLFEAAAQAAPSTTTTPVTSEQPTTTITLPLEYPAPALPGELAAVLDRSPITTAVVSVANDQQLFQFLRGTRVVDSEGRVLSKGSRTRGSPAANAIAFLFGIAPIGVVALSKRSNITVDGTHEAHLESRAPHETSGADGWGAIAVVREPPATRAPPRPATVAKPRRLADLDEYLPHGEHVDPQCPNCGWFDVAEPERSASGARSLVCTTCTHSWNWRPGEPWPDTIVDPEALLGGEA